MFELHALTHIARSQDHDPFVAAGKFMTTIDHDATNADEIKAVSVIEELLGKKALEYTRQPGLANGLCVRLALSSRKFEVNGEDFFDLVQGIDFKKSEAHQYALSVCLGICRVTTLGFGNLRNERPHLLGLVTYAWTYWSVHHRLAYNYVLLSDRYLLNAALMEQLRCTTRDVLFDTVKLLIELNGRLIPFANQLTHDGVDERILLGKDALDLLHLPLCLLSNMIKVAPVDPIREMSEDLAMGRRICRNSMYLQPTDRTMAEESLSRTFPSGLHYNMVPDTIPAFTVTTHERPTANLARAWPGFSGLNTDILLTVVKGQTALGSCRETIVILVEAARQIRLLSMLIAHDLSKNPAFTTTTSLETLVNVADFLEALACYPFWDLMPKPYSEQYFEVAETHPGSRVYLGRYLDWANNEKSFIEHREDLRARVGSSGQKPNTQTRLSSSQHFALGLKRDIFPRPNNGPWDDQTDTSNGKRGPSPGARIFAHLHQVSIFPDLGPVDWVYLQVKLALISDGCISALAKITMAIVANHVRTIFVPWLGIGIWQNPLEQLRLARSNPEVFLDEFHAQTWAFILFSLAQSGALESLAYTTVRKVANSQLVENRLLAKYRGENPALGVVWYITWLFTSVEYLFSAGVVLFAVILAFWKLARGGSETANLALWMVIGNHWPKMIFTGGQMVYFLFVQFLPVLSIAVESAADGCIGLSLFIAGLVALVRAIIVYRSFFFIALEASGMFVAIGWFLVGCWILLAWFWDDPAGVKHTVAHAMRSGEVARKCLEMALAYQEEASDTY